MVNNNTKNHSVPVVEKREKDTCTCGSDCKCGCGCGCNCGRAPFGQTFLRCTSMMVSAALIAGAIVLQPSLFPPQQMPVPMPRHTGDRDIELFIRKNPQVLAEALAANTGAKPAEAKKAEPARPGFDLNRLETADATLVQKIIDDPTNYSLGNPKGKFVIIEFFDYQCGWCKRTNKGLEEAIATPAGKNIRWIPIDTPIFGAASETIARYVLAAGEQGKYAEMHAAVGADTTELSAARQRVGERVEEYINQNGLDRDKDRERIWLYSEEVAPAEYAPALLNIAKKLGLNGEKLTAAADGEAIRKKMEANDEFRRALNISGVPMLIVDGHINPGALIGENLEAVVKLSAE